MLIERATGNQVLHSQAGILSILIMASTLLSLASFNLTLNKRKSQAPPKRTTTTITNMKSTTRPIYIPNSIPHPSYVRVLDTTLRDGEQTLGVNFTLDQKIDIACQLARLGVDVIEAGFPATSPEAVKVVKSIALAVGSGAHVPVINVLSRCVRSDIDVSWEALRRAEHPRVTLFIATSEIHMRHKLRKSKAEVLAQVKDAVAYAKSLGFQDIAFGSEDASRSVKEFLYVVFEEAIAGGATTVILADTVGYMLPHEWTRLIEDVRTNVKGIENVVISTHCHDDLGLATANTLAAIGAGARQVEVTINGLGERAGNAPLEELVMALKCRGNDLLGGLHTGINTELIAFTSEMVERYSGLAIHPNKAIVGANVFSHAAGIHQDGVLKNRRTYEILSPQDIGRLRSTDLGIALGKHSGRHGLQYRLRQLGFNLDDKKFDQIFAHFKAMAENEKNISDEDISSLVTQAL